METTPEHPFYVEGEGWVNAEDLQLGDDIRNADDSTGEVESIEFEQTEQEMYNLTVDEAHTFFVGDGQWLVHNDGLCDPTELPLIVRHYTSYDGYKGIVHLDQPGPNMIRTSFPERSVGRGVYFTNTELPPLDFDITSVSIEQQLRMALMGEVGIDTQNLYYFIDVAPIHIPGDWWTRTMVSRVEYIFLSDDKYVDITKAIVNYGPTSDLLKLYLR